MIPTVPQRALAAALERHRELAGLSRADVRQALGWSPMKPYRIETARVTVSPADARRLALLYGLSDTETTELEELARQAREPGWWSGLAQSLPAGFAVHLDLESSARTIRMFADQFVPGLLQTEAYAREVLGAHSIASTPEQVVRQVEVRMRRQQILTRGDPPELEVILDEGVLRRAVGGRAVMASQLRHLREAARVERAIIRVLPFSAGAHMAAYGAFSLFSPADSAFPVTASTDRPAGTLIEDDPVAIGQYTTIFDHLRTIAHASAKSLAFISEAEELL
jgi:hypothetical protein